MIDVSTYLPYRWDPKIFGSGYLVKGDLTAWLNELSGQMGVPAILLRGVHALSMAATIYHGMMTGWHMFATVGCGLGVYLPEEWPMMMDKPWLSTSLNELWGKRFHQTLRVRLPILIYVHTDSRGDQDFFTLLLQPFHLSRPMYIVAIFFLSALLHTWIGYPHNHEIIPTLYPYCVLFVGSGIGCILERQFYRFTGRRVDGFWGWLWTWSFLAVISAPNVDFEWSRGWQGCMRGTFEGFPVTSPVLWVAYWLGHGPSPKDVTVWRG
jgi:hypothetical protein